MFLHNFLYVLVEVVLQVAIVLQAVRFHERLDLRVRIPLLAVHFVAADMEIISGKSAVISASSFSRNW